MPRRGDRRGDEPDEDALETMYDQPALGWAHDEDDSDNDSTQLEWVSPLDPGFGDGKPPERFPTDEPLPPPRRLAPDFGTPVRAPPEPPSQAEQTELRKVVSGPSDEDLPLESEEIDPTDLLPDDPEATAPPPPVASPPGRPGRPPHSGSIPISRTPPVPNSLVATSPGPRPRRRRESARIPERSRSGERELPTAAEAGRVAGLLGVGLVVGVVAALLVLALAATWWLAAAG